jgi:hypothetical protein
MSLSLSQATFDPSRRLVLLGQFESMVGEVVRLRTHGSDGVEIARAQGAADGFARALISSGIASDADLLQAAQAARRGGAGPATRTIEATESAATLIDSRRVTLPSEQPARVVA